MLQMACSLVNNLEFEKCRWAPSKSGLSALLLASCACSCSQRQPSYLAAAAAPSPSSALLSLSPVLYTSKARKGKAVWNPARKIVTCQQR